MIIKALLWRGKKGWQGLLSAASVPTRVALGNFEKMNNFKQAEH